MTPYKLWKRGPLYEGKNDTWYVKWGLTRKDGIASPLVDQTWLTVVRWEDTEGQQFDKMYDDMDKMLVLNHHYAERDAVREAFWAVGCDTSRVDRFREDFNTQCRALGIDIDKFYREGSL